MGGVHAAVIHPTMGPEPDRAGAALFANQSLSDTFAGIRPTDAPGFILAQLLALVLTLPLLHRTPKHQRTKGRNGRFRRD